MFGKNDKNKKTVLVFSAAAVSSLAVTAVLAMTWTVSSTDSLGSETVDPFIGLTAVSSSSFDDEAITSDVVGYLEGKDLQDTQKGLSVASIGDDLRPFIQKQNEVIVALLEEKNELSTQLKSIQDENILLEIAISQLQVPMAEDADAVSDDIELETPKSFIDALKEDISFLSPSNVSETFEDIKAHLDQIDTHVAIFSQGEEMTMNFDERRAYEELRADLLEAQKTALPELRNKLGPALRAVYEETGITVYTTGEGFKTIMVKSDNFDSIEDIREFHEENHEELIRMRFSNAVYTDLSGSSVLGRVEVKSVPDDMFLINDRVSYSPS